MAHPDLEELLDALLPFAEQMLRKNGEFYPFGALMKADGAIAMVGAQVPGTEFPKSVDVIDLLEAGLRKEVQEGSIRASGICLDVRVIPPGQRDKTDAIQANLEHREGEAVSVFLPYKKGLFKKLTFGDLFATPAEAKIFTTAQR